MQGQEKNGSCKKETATSIVLSMLEATAKASEKIAAIVGEKTNSVTRQEPARPDSNKLQPATPREENQHYPPLLSRIKELVESINNSLDRIEDIMRRCEL